MLLTITIVLMYTMARKTIHHRYIYGEQFSKKQDKTPSTADADDAIRQIILDWLLPIPMVASSFLSLLFSFFRKHLHSVLTWREIAATAMSQLYHHVALFTHSYDSVRWNLSRIVRWKRLNTKYNRRKERERKKYKREENNSSSCTTFDLYLFFFFSLLRVVSLVSSSLLNIRTTIRSINFHYLPTITQKSLSHSWLFLFLLRLCPDDCEKSSPVENIMYK